MHTVDTSSGRLSGKYDNYAEWKITKVRIDEDIYEISVEISKLCLFYTLHVWYSG